MKAPHIIYKLDGQDTYETIVFSTQEAIQYIKNNPNTAYRLRKISLYEIKQRIGTNYKITYPFGNEIQIWNLKNFITNADKTIKHKRLPIITSVFLNNCYEVDQSEEVTHG